MYSSFGSTACIQRFKNAGIPENWSLGVAIREMFWYDNISALWKRLSSKSKIEKAGNFLEDVSW